MSTLFSPLQIKNLTFSSRVIMPPMATGKSNEAGTPTEDLITYYKDKTDSEKIGMVITEHAYITKDGMASKGQLSLADDGVIEGLKKLAATIHDNHTLVFAQLNHAGGAADTTASGLPSIGPSITPLPRRKNMAEKEMDEEDIHRIIQAFYDGAKRAIVAGYDGVEIHSAHGYLLNQFYSPLSNKRHDAYGGTLDNRIRLHLAIISAVRKAVGDAVPIALRLGACDYLEGGSTIEDAIYAAKQFEKAGIDLLDISGGHNGYTIPGHSEEGYFSPVSSAIRQAVNIPVILTGGVVTAAGAEQLLSEGAADLIGVGRAILKDSLWMEKAFAQLH